MSEDHKSLKQIIDFRKEKLQKLIIFEGIRIFRHYHRFQRKILHRLVWSKLDLVKKAFI